MRNLIYLIVFLFGSFSICNSQENYVLGNTKIRNFLPEEYGALNQIWNIVQDHRGVMYFASGNSVVEYDGKNWKPIITNTESMVFSLGIDLHGTVYAGTNGDFGYLAINENGGKEYISFKDKIPEEHKNFSTVWQINSTTNGVYFSTQKGIFRLYKNKIEVLEFGSSPFIFSAYDNIFVNDSSGMTVLKNNIPLLLPHTEELKKTKGLCHTLPFINKKLLFVLQKHGLYLYDYNLLCKNGVLRDSFNTIKIGSDILTKLSTECDEYFKKYRIYTCCIVNDTSIAIGTLGGGIVILNNEGKLINIINKNRGLVDDIIYHLYTDNQQNLWAATNNGISYIQLSSPFTVFDKKNGLESSILSTIEYKRRIYTGTFNSCLFLPQYKFNQENDQHKFKAIIEGQIWTLETINDLLFAGTPNALYQIKDTVSKKIFDTNNVIYSISASPKFPNYIFLGLRNSFTAVKLHYPDPTKSNKEDSWVKPIEKETKTFPELNYSIREICNDKHGNLWISTELNGIFYLKFSSDILNDYKVFKFGTLSGLPSKNSNTLYINDNKIYVATIKGIYEAIISDTVSDFNESSVKFVRSKELNVMSNDSIGVERMTFDKNKIWILSGKARGVLCKENEGYKFESIVFKEIEGAIYNIYPDKNGIVWFGTSTWLHRYNSNKEKDYKPVYNALIRKVAINSDSILFFGNYYNDSIIDKKKVRVSSISQIPKLCPVLSYRDNNIVFEYSAAFYEYADKLTYKYILEGYDKATSDWIQETKKEYTNLPEGDYCFKVKAKNIFEHESTIATYKFSILPPWHRTWWVYSIYVVLAVLFMYVVAKLNSRRLKAANVKLENLVKERTIEIQQQNKEIKKQAEELETYNEELTATNEELHYQKEKIQAHEEELETINEELTSTNEELHYQREEILAQNNKLKEMDEFKQGMTSMIVHDLKNPLNSIINVSKTITPEKQVGIIQQSGKQMLNMVLNILDVHKYEEVEMRLELENKQLVLIAMKALSQVQFLIEQKAIDLKNEIDSQIVAKVDEEVIERVLVNLLTNAIKYTPTGGNIILSAALESEEMVRISVSDTGEGIADDKADLVFQKFGQIVAKKSGGVRSTGLGLSFCKLAVEAHGGEIGFTSEVEKGTTFWFTLLRGNVEIISIQTLDKLEVIELESIVFTEGEKEILAPIISKLIVFTVYETDDIEEILDELKQNKSENIQKWIAQVENSMATLNQFRFLELLKVD